MKELLEMIERCTGPDRELDRDILKALEPFGVDPWLDEKPTASIDASLALVEKVMPGWSYALRTEEHHENGFRAELWQSWGPDAYKRTEAVCRPTQPLAILAALLRAHMERKLGVPERKGAG